MKFAKFGFEFKKQTPVVFDQQEGKTLEEYRQELLIKMMGRQFEKLNQLGLSIPVRLG
ncbi:MAG TPA: hypothetical protein VLF20_05090 [Patescibacteria group bacterium]|nr:hypothetical protein [Patescibacteria group bacterium]